MDARTRIRPLKEKEQSLTGSELITYVSFTMLATHRSKTKGTVHGIS